MILTGYQFLFLAAVVVVAIYQKPLVGACWIALGCGLIMDLLYAQDRLGPYTVSFVVATALIYNQKKHFFADNLMTMPVMCLLFSVAATLTQLFYIMAMERSISLSVSWVFVDLLILPTLDGLIAFALFIAPAFLLGFRPRKGEEYFAE